MSITKWLLAVIATFSVLTLTSTAVQAQHRPGGNRQIGGSPHKIQPNNLNRHHGHDLHHGHHGGFHHGHAMPYHGYRPPLYGSGYIRPGYATPYRIGPSWHHYQHHYKYHHNPFHHGHR